MRNRLFKFIPAVILFTACSFHGDCEKEIARLHNEIADSDKKIAHLEGTLANFSKVQIDLGDGSVVYAVLADTTYPGQAIYKEYAKVVPAKKGVKR